MKTTHIILPALALSAAALVSCDDYTDRNFGTRDELYQPTQVNHHVIDLTDAQYAAVAAAPANIEAAEAEGVADRLAAVGTDKCFNAAIAPEDYLLPIIKDLVGKTPYYTMDAGSTVTVVCKVSEQLKPTASAYVPATSFTEGKYLIVPAGQKQPLGNSGLTAAGDHPGSGLLYLAGTEKCAGVTPIGDNAFVIDATSKGYLYTFEKVKRHYHINNATGYYLYLDGTHSAFQYTDDIESDCDDPDYALWDVTMNADGNIAIVNVGTGQQVYFDPDNSYAGCYSVPANNHIGLRLYNIGKAEPEQQSVIFGYNGNEWACKADYINQTLLGQTSTDVETIFALSGWSLEFIGGIGDLTYVWKLDGIYGLRASAYKSSTYYPTDAWCISPALNLKKAKAPLFTFQEAQKYAGTPLEDYLQVFVSTDYAGRGSLQSAHWTDVTARLEGTRPDGSSWDYSDMSLDLTEWAGNPDVRVAFRYISTDAVAATWEVKNVVCKEKE